MSLHKYGSDRRHAGVGTNISNHLIIDVRHKLPWRQRIVSDTGTAGLWMAWLWLCRSGIGVIGLLRVAATHPAALGLIAAGSAAVLFSGALTIGGASGALWLWNKIVGGQHEEAPVSAPNYAAYFGISDPQLHRCRSAQVCIVHHDAEGRILAIETEIPHPPAAADASGAAGACGPMPLQHAA